MRGPQDTTKGDANCVLAKETQPLNYRNDDPPEEVPKYPTSWTSAVVIALLLIAVVVAFVLVSN